VRENLTQTIDHYQWDGRDGSRFPELRTPNFGSHLSRPSRLSRSAILLTRESH